MREGLAGCDVVVMLRLQSERMRGALLPSTASTSSTTAHAGKARAGEADAIVMHPGPMNRGVEIESAVADGERSVILPQVTFGIAVRMAVLSILAGLTMGPHGSARFRLTHEDRDQPRPRDRSRTRHRSRRIALHRRGQGGRGRAAPSGWLRERKIDAGGSSSARDSSTFPRACASRASNTRPRSNRRWTAPWRGVTSLACPPDTDPPLDEPGWSRC
jgi:hypothetical protein